MKQKSNFISEFSELIIVGILVVGLFFSFALLPSVGHTAEVTLENCEPGSWVGMVRWLDNKTNFEHVEGARLQNAGSLSLQLPAGDYAITHRYPRSASISVLDVIEFREVTITNEDVTISFGCEE